MIISQCNNTTLASSPSIWVGTSEAYQTSSSLIPNNSLSFVTDAKSESSPVVVTTDTYCVVSNVSIKDCIRCYVYGVCTSTYITGNDPDYNCSLPRYICECSCGFSCLCMCAALTGTLELYENGTVVCTVNVSDSANSCACYTNSKGCTICFGMASRAACYSGSYVTLNNTKIALCPDGSAYGCRFAVTSGYRCRYDTNNSNATMAVYLANPMLCVYYCVLNSSKATVCNKENEFEYSDGCLFSKTCGNNPTYNTFACISLVNFCGCYFNTPSCTRSSTFTLTYN